MPLSSSSMASSVDGTSFTLTDDRSGEDTSGEVTHDIDSNSVLSKPSKVRKRCVKNNDVDDDDDGNSGVNKYPRVNGDADVSSCRTEFTDEVLSNRYNLCHAILLPSTGVSERHINIVLQLWLIMQELNIGSTFLMMWAMDKNTLRKLFMMHCLR